VSSCRSHLRCRICMLVSACVHLHLRQQSDNMLSFRRSTRSSASTATSRRRRSIPRHHGSHVRGRQWRRRPALARSRRGQCRRTCTGAHHHHRGRRVPRRAIRQQACLSHSSRMRCTKFPLRMHFCPRAVCMPEVTHPSIASRRRAKCRFVRCSIGCQFARHCAHARQRRRGVARGVGAAAAGPLQPHRVRAPET
jgi:hypothetical protein